jgi:hypothetical protein
MLRRLGNGLPKLLMVAAWIHGGKQCQAIVGLSDCLAYLLKFCQQRFFFVGCITADIFF